MKSINIKFKFNILTILLFIYLFHLIYLPLNPPIFKILPVNVISPVMAILSFTGWFIAKDNNAVVIVQPADGPILL